MQILFSELIGTGAVNKGGVEKKAVMESGNGFSEALEGALRQSGDEVDKEGASGPSAAPNAGDEALEDASLAAGNLEAEDKTDEAGGLLPFNVFPDVVSASGASVESGEIADSSDIAASTAEAEEATEMKGCGPIEEACLLKKINTPEQNLNTYNGAEGAEVSLELPLNASGNAGQPSPYNSGGGPDEEVSVAYANVAEAVDEGSDAFDVSGAAAGEEAGVDGEKSAVDLESDAGDNADSVEEPEEPDYFVEEGVLPYLPYFAPAAYLEPVKGAQAGPKSASGLEGIASSDSGIPVQASSGAAGAPFDAQATVLSVINPVTNGVFEIEPDANGMDASAEQEETVEALINEAEKEADLSLIEPDTSGPAGLKALDKAVIDATGKSLRTEDMRPGLGSIEDIKAASSNGASENSFSRSGDNACFDNEEAGDSSFDIQAPDTVQDGSFEVSGAFTAEKTAFENPGAIETTREADTAGIYGLLDKGVKTAVARGESEIRLSLHPEHLGEMDIRLKSEDGMINAEILVENSEVKAILESDSSKLKEIFSNSGLTLDSFKVGITSGSAGTDGGVLKEGLSSWGETMRQGSQGEHGQDSRSNRGYAWNGDGSRKEELYAGNPYQAKTGRGTVDLFI